jgi:O-antigen/teichoic acid export membrane protein
MMLLAAIANLGTSAALIQRLPRAGPHWSRTLTASLTTATLAGLAVALLAAVVVLPDLSPRLSVVGSSASYTLLFTIGVAVWSLSVVSDYLFIAERRTENMLVRNTGFGIAKLVAVGVLAAAGDTSPLGIFGAWVGGCAVSLVAAYLVLVPRLGRRYRFELSGVGRQIREMVTSYAGNYLITLGNVLPMFLLPVLVITRRSAADNAYFYVTWLVGGAFFTISSAVGSALFAEGRHDPHRLSEQMRSGARITAALLAPMMLLFFVGAGWILGLFGNAYADKGETLLLLLTASAIPDAITNLYVARLRAEGRLAFPAAMNIAMALITLGGTWVLLPPLGLAGPGVAWIAAQSVGSAACFLDAARSRRRAAPHRSAVT